MRFENFVFTQKTITYIYTQIHLSLTTNGRKKTKPRMKPK